MQIIVKLFLTSLCLRYKLFVSPLTKRKESGMVDFKRISYFSSVDKGRLSFESPVFAGLCAISIQIGKEVNFEDLPHNSIALDGYVQGPVIDVAGNRYSFDHHDRCVRLCTRATCQQVLCALLSGFDLKTIREIFINDIDADVMMSVWLLLNPELARESRIRKIVDIIGDVDTFGQAYPVFDSSIASDIYTKVMTPAYKLKKKHSVETWPARVLSDCFFKMDGYIKNGKIVEAPKNNEKNDFEVVHSGTGWAMIKSTKTLFPWIYKHHKKIIIVNNLPDGKYAYVVGKASEFIENFPVGPQSMPGTILHALNEIEKGWGGSTTFGGSPRTVAGSRSNLSPLTVFNIVEKIVLKTTKGGKLKAGHL